MSGVILAAASSSRNQDRVPVVGLTCRAGRSSVEVGSKMRWRMSCLPAPAATNATWCAWFSTGKVSVILLGGGFGESVIEAHHSVFSFNNGWFGNKEQV